MTPKAKLALQILIPTIASVLASAATVAVIMRSYGPGQPAQPGRVAQSSPSEQATETSDRQGVKSTQHLPIGFDPKTQKPKITIEIGKSQPPGQIFDECGDLIDKSCSRESSDFLTLAKCLEKNKASGDHFCKKKSRWSTRSRYLAKRTYAKYASTSARAEAFGTSGKHSLEVSLRE